MKYLLWLFIPILLLGQVKTVTQTGVKRSLIRGDATTLTWTVTGDYSADSLLFIAVDNDSNAVLRLTTSGGLTASYSGQRTTITGTIYAAATENFISGGYLYDISSVTDSITLIMGLLTVIADVSNLEDTVLAPIPYYTVALDTPAANNNFIIGMDSNNVWYQKTLAQTKTILGIDTLSGNVNVDLDSLYTKTSHIVNVKEFGAVGNSITDDTEAMQSALDYAQGGTLVFPEGNFLQTQPLYVHSNTKIIGYGATLVIPDSGWSLGCNGNYGSPSSGCNYGMVILQPDDPSTETIENITIEGLSFRGTKSEGIGQTPKFIYMNSVSNIRVINCDFRNTKYEGIWEGESALLNEGHNINIQILGNYFYDVGKDNEYPALPAIQMNAQQAIINNNILIEVGAGIAYSGASGTIVGNYIKNCTGKGISTGDAYRDGVMVISGNTVETTVVQSGTACYYFLGSVTGSRNEILNVTGNVAILRGQPTVNNFTIPAIHVTNYVENINFIGNTVQIDSSGIGFKIEVVQDSAKVSFVGNKIILERDADTSSIGFQIYATTSGDTLYTRFSNNQIEGFGGNDYAYYFATANGGVNNYILTNEMKDGGMMSLQELYSSGEYNDVAFSYSSIRDNPSDIIGDFNVKDTLSIGFIKISGMTFDTTGLKGGDLYYKRETGEVYYAVPKNLILNYDFKDWSGTSKSQIPDNWQITIDTTALYVEESPTGQAHLVVIHGDGQFHPLNIFSETGEEYGYSFDVTQIVDTAIVYCGGGYGFYIGGTGTYTGQATALGVYSVFTVLAQDTSIGCEITLDNVRVWKKIDSEIQSPVYIHNLPYVNNFLNPTTDDTLSLFLTDRSLQIDSIQFRVDDSIGVKLTYGASGLGTTILESDTLVSGWQTITGFNDNTVEVDNEVYLYFTYMGDTATFIKWKIYWRD